MSLPTQPNDSLQINFHSVSCKLLCRNSLRRYQASHSCEILRMHDLQSLFCGNRILIHQQERQSNATSRRKCFPLPLDTELDSAHWLPPPPPLCLDQMEPFPVTVGIFACWLIVTEYTIMLEKAKAKSKMGRKQFHDNQQTSERRALQQVILGTIHNTVQLFAVVPCFCSTFGFVSSWWCCSSHVCTTAVFESEAMFFPWHIIGSSMACFTKCAHSASNDGYRFVLACWREEKMVCWHSKRTACSRWGVSKCPSMELGVNCCIWYAKA